MTPEPALTRLGEALSLCAREGRPVDPEALAAELGLPVDVVRDYQAALASLTPPSGAPPRCGPYELRGELGRGGMGTVYRAWDPRLEREVALKLVHRVSSEVALRRFQREADALARLEHPGLIRVLDVGAEREQPYLVMPLVEGRSLADRLRREGTLPVREAVAIARDLALALAHAHAQGVLHRDVKPSNVLLVDGGGPLLIDFGLARETERGLSRISLSGVFLGTPGYWPPEQAQGDWDAVGPPADVYALGATLYACLTGEAPIPAGESVIDSLSLALTHAPEPPSRLTPAVDRALDAIVLRCLAKSPAERYPDMQALAEVLTGWLEPSPRGRRSAGLALGALAAGAALAGTFAIAPAPPQTLDPIPAPAQPASTSPPSLRDDPRWTEALAALREGRLPYAEALARGHLEQDPGDAHARLVLAGALVAQDRCADAAALLEGFEAAPADRGYLSKVRGYARLRLGDLAGAEKDFEHVIAAGEQAAPIWAGLAQARAGLERWQACLDAAERALALDPNLLAALGLRGAARCQLDDPEGGLADLARALELDPAATSTRILRAERLVALGRLEEAAEDYRVVRLSQAVPELSVLAALAQLRLRLDQPRASLSVAEALVQAYPDHSAGWTLLAQAHDRLGNKGAALQALRRALERTSDDPHPLWVRAQILASQGHPKAAIQDLRVAIALAKTGAPELVPDMERLLEACTQQAAAVEQGR